MRLNRYVASATGLSRRAADDLIATGNVLLNGRPGMHGDQVLEADRVEIDGEVISPPTLHSYIALHKPVGYVSSRLQQGSSPTIYNLLPTEYHRLKSVGRLDKDSSGLILLTDDGKLAFNLAHPSADKTKTYEVTLDHELTPAEITRLRSGMKLEDGISRFDSLTGSERHWTVTLHEGRNRQVRRTFAAIGATVTALHRTSFGRLKLDSLRPGQWRLVSPEEII